MATKSIAWNSGGGYIRLTYTGSGNGHIRVESDDNSLGTARSQTITVRTTDGGVITKNLTVNQAACPFPVNHVETFNYTGDVQSVTLPAGRYKLQCWGAQGGSNDADYTYGITANAGGKGGYSEGVLTLSEPTTVYIFVGGEGASSGNGGWNCGAGGPGSYSYVDGNTRIETRYAGGGGATDIALETSAMSYSSYMNIRTDASLLSRIIVAGGGSGGSAAATITTSTSSITYAKADIGISGWCIGADPSNTWYNKWFSAPTYYTAGIIDVSSYQGGTCVITKGDSTILYAFLTAYPTAVSSYASYASGYSRVLTVSSDQTLTIPSDAIYLYVYKKDTPSSVDHTPNSVSLSLSTTSISNISQIGYYGGGTTGGAYRSNEQATQDSAGILGSFGRGGRLDNSYYRGAYKSGLGGAGWYGGGVSEGLYEICVRLSGGGSGFVNTSASASHRPSGYTGLQLDSGETKAGNTSFPNTAGTGNETGHSGNGYAKITRLL